MSSTESEKTPPAVTGRCVVCKQRAYYKPADSPESQGHIYNARGLKDWHQCQTCQPCVDRVYFRIETITTAPAKKPGNGGGLY